MSVKQTISAIVSTYNSPAYLHRALEGYRLQNAPPNELIVADDGSTSETANIVEQFKAKAPFAVRHVWHEDTGFRLAAIRNRAIASASGDYLIFTDGDCIPHPQFIADHRSAMKEKYFITGKRMLISKELSATFEWRGAFSALAQCLNGGLSGGHHLLRIPSLAIPCKDVKGLRGCNMAMFRSDLLAVNGFNENITGWGREDSELVARLFAYGLKRLDLPFAAMVFHLWHPENSRSSLDKNDQLLEETVASGSFRCINGIVKEQ